MILLMVSKNAKQKEYFSLSSLLFLLKASSCICSRLCVQHGWPRVSEQCFSAIWAMATRKNVRAHDFCGWWITLPVTWSQISSRKGGRILKCFFLYASIAVNLRLLVYRYGMQNSGNESSWNYMFKMYQETSLAQEKEKLLYGLASVNNISLLDRWFTYTKIILSLETQLFTVCSFTSPLSRAVILSDYSMRNATHFKAQLSNTPLRDCTIVEKKPCSFSGKMLNM